LKDEQSVKKKREITEFDAEQEVQSSSKPAHADNDDVVSSFNFLASDAQELTGMNALGELPNSLPFILKINFYWFSSGMWKSAVNDRQSASNSNPKRIANEA
jgi:hypothetical protein